MEGTTYYFIRPKEDKCIWLPDIGSIIPALSLKKNTDRYFGGWLINEPDLRSFEILSQLDKVLGLEVLEGGCNEVYISGKDLFRTKEEAEKQFNLI